MISEPGYSNFHYLNELRPDIIKIDRSFTAKAIKDAKEYDLLKTILHYDTPSEHKNLHRRCGD
ncbi:MAG: EAL domain-containing protein [Coprococcus sp.]